MGKLTPFHALIALSLVASCAPTTTTLRFTGDGQAVAVQNPEQPRVGSRLETLVGTRKKLFFYVTRDATITSVRSTVDPGPGEKKLIAQLTINQHPVRFSVIRLRQPLADPSPPTLQNKDGISSSPVIRGIIGSGPTSIVGVGRGSWISAATPTKHLYFRPFDYDLVVLVDADDLEPARAADFILRMGSLTFEHGR